MANSADFNRNSVYFFFIQEKLKENKLEVIADKLKAYDYNMRNTLESDKKTQYNSNIVVKLVN